MLLAVGQRVVEFANGVVEARMSQFYLAGGAFDIGNHVAPTLGAETIDLAPQLGTGGIGEHEEA
jgi:uncharacterized protein YgbK (DUF1537 family)